MRIAVDCRYLALSPALLTRGIPRYIRQQLTAVLRQDREHQYVLLHRDDDDVTQLPAEVRAAPNVTLQVFPGDTGRLPRPEHSLRATEELEAWLCRDRIDVFHTPAPWLPVATVFPRIDACAVVTTVYDFIPSLFQEHLQGIMRDSWALAVEQLRRSTRLIAISEATRRDATLYGEVPPSRIDVAYPYAEEYFRPLEPEVVEARLASLRRSQNLSGRFIMTVSFPGFRNKNLETLLDGYRRLPVGLRRTLPLVVVGAQGPSGEGLHEMSRRFGIQDDVRVTGIISNDEIAALYNAATMLVCPSRYEGFGMPIVEAMQCGTPVIATSVSSMPEVVGDASWLVNPEDGAAFAGAIAALADSDEQRHAMRAAGFEQAKRFTSDALGRATLESFVRAGGGDRSSSDAAPRHRPRIAVCMPNPVGVADAGRAEIETADALRGIADVDLFFTGDGVPSVELLRRFGTHDISALDRVHGSRPYDAVLRASSDIARGWRVTTASGERTVSLDAVLPGVPDPLGPQPDLQREQARAVLGVSTSSFVVLWPERGTTQVDVQMGMLAIADVCRACPDTVLFVPCDPATGRLPDNVAVQAQVAGLSERVRAQVPAERGASPGLVAATADVYLAAADVVVAMAGVRPVVTPHGVMRACAAGKPVVVDDTAAWSWLPADACLKLPAETFGTRLARILHALSHDRVRSDALGRAARAAYLRQWTMEHLRERWLTALAPALRDVRVDERASAPHTDAGDVVEPLGYNRVCNIEDFAHPALVAEMHEVLPHKVRHFGPTFPRGIEHCKDWEVAMATRTLRHFGAIQPGASILGVAAGMEDTIYYLSKHVREVMVVDRYAQAGAWGLNSPLWMLVCPEWGAHDACDPERLVVQHMDARRLRFPDDRFDGIFSSGSIEHFGGLMDVAHAAYEMGRVLKPGGILSLSTVMTIAGPSDRLNGEPGNCLLFHREHLIRYIVEASGLELVDVLVTDATPATHAVHRSLEQVLLDNTRRAAEAGLKGLQEDDRHAEVPCLVLDWDGVTFDSVHLALRKPLSGWGTANAWACPTASVEARIREDYRRLVEERGAWMPTSPAVLVPVDRPDVAARRARESTRMHFHQRTSTLASQLEGVRSEIERLTPEGPSTWPDTWQPVPIRVPDLPEYSVIVDISDRRDIVADAFAKGFGTQVNVVEFSLIRAFLKPGDAVIDAGAHLGSITLPLAAFGCPVLAVEASSRNVALLRAACAYNGFRDVTVVHAAAAAAEGSLSFYADGAWGWVAAPGEAANEVVPAIAIDDLVDALGWTRVEAIKIDVEGAELAAIAGLSRLLSRPDAPPVYYESNTHTHTHAGTTVDQVVAALENVGYRSYAVSAGRLTRVRPGDRQDVMVRDHLAVKGALPAIPLLTIDERNG